MPANRWQHKCPRCKRVIHWERVYCRICILDDPKRGRFRVDRNTSYRGTSLFRGQGPVKVQPSRQHLYALIRAYTLCVECGHKVKLNDLKHRCYFLTEQSSRTLKKIRCRVCRIFHPKHSYPAFKRRHTLLRSRICSDCLNGAQVVQVQKRKYVRRRTIEHHR